jgi:hypothetical protein
MQDRSGPEKTPTLLRIFEDSYESHDSIPASPMSSVVPLGDATQASGTAMTSYIASLLEAAFLVDYDQYGIQGSPTGSLVSIGDAAEAASGCTVSSSPSPIPVDYSIYRFVICLVPA